MSTFFGFAIADSMFQPSCTVSRKPLSLEEVREILENENVEFCLNPSHAPTVEAAKKMGLCIRIPESAPRVALKPGDSVLVMSIRGLPRLEGRHEYTEEEVAKATFSFGVWTVH